jgi:Predicted inhibitor of MCP methylation, homolog of CheC
MDTSIVAAFSHAAKSTFKDMFGLEAIESGSRELGASEGHGWDLTGLVGLAGQAQGVVAIRLTQSLIAGLLAGSGVAAGGEEERRALEGGLVGEMTNIIAGSAISAIHGLDIEIAPPVVVRGPNHTIGWPAIAPVVALFFKLPPGEASGGFEIDLCIRH